MTVAREEPELRLAADFPEVTRDAWREAALAVLRKSGVDPGAPHEVEEALSHTTYDGVTLRPLYDASDAEPDASGVPGHPPYVRGGRLLGGWEVRQRHAVADPAAVAADLAGGVTSIWLVAGEGGIPVAELPAMLAGIDLAVTPVVLDAGAQTREAAGILLAAGATKGNLGADPLGLAARTGGAPDLAVAADLARRCADGPLRAVTVDATPYHDAGGSDAEELGCSIATGIAYLRALTDAGLSLERAFGHLEFRYAATADQFLTIAKLRAARLMWARVAEECEAAPTPQRQHAVTSAAMMTARDPWVNMLRTTVACFAAGVGGADAVTVRPFDACLGLPDDFARRIARNTQSLLLMEAHVGRVADPAGGSWYVERLTRDLAEAAWAWLQEIERAGGMTAALASGLVADRIAATWDRRSANIARRRDPIIGVSEFPNLQETLPERPPAPPAPGGGLPVVRYAQEFERLRDIADARAERPVVFLATIGPLAEHNARASFAANLFGAGGIAAVPGGADTDPAAIAEAFRRSGARVACLCSSDRLYGEHAAAVAAALREAGAVRVWLAGRGEYDGVDGNVYAGCDALAVLRTTLTDTDPGEAQA
ncbi:methylmalonyl-CoA mutase family protein [Thermostaphylospora chromogena]|uniref:Heterodimeric methylmalonyl-CoA mutase small subunit n=1 Tax=Thermostaphylospora chromogena TaxID=35622 RepID=A0A1H1GJS4_9ACTN|nr:methylmalonyl-CoA mutase family protein [Thermostaphylospora chromogena]SDR13450.1 heterodimeric methylmalonyl-CoA mutase small subunit [Thermostaphylospora chromogena]